MNTVLKPSDERFVVRNLYEAMDYSLDNIYSHELVSSESFICSLFCLKRDTRIEHRIYPGQAAMQVIEGRANLQLDGETVEVHQGSFVFIPANTAHSVHAEEDSSFLVCLSIPYY